MPGRAHRDRDVVLAAHPDRLLVRHQRPEPAVLLPLVVRHPLEVQVGDVRAEVGEAPRDVGVVADDHAGHTGEGEPGHVERAVRGDRRAVQPHLHPDAGDADAEVRVVGQQRLPGLGVRAVDDPAVAADPVALAHQLRQVGQHAVQGRQLVALARRVRRPLRVPRTSRGRVLLEHPVDDGALADDRVLGLVVVRREQLGHLLGRVVGRDQGALDLLVEVALQVPRHRLEPGQGVDRRPRLGPVVEAAQAQHGVLHGDLGGTVCLEVGVDAGGVRLQRRAGLRLQQRQLLLGDAAPAQGADELVGLQGVGPEELREPAGRDVPAHVHLVEALLRVHVALRGHQVGQRVAVQLRDPVVVADHLHLGAQARHLDRAVDLREGPAHQDHGGHQAGDQQQDDHEHGVRRPPRGPRPPAEGLPPRPRGEFRVAHRGSQCAVPLAVACGECQAPSKGNRAHLSVRLHRVRARLRPGPELLRRRADRVPGVPGPAAQALQRRRCGLQGLRFLPHRQPGAAKSASSSSSETKTETKSETKTETKSDTKTETSTPAKPEKKSDTKAPATAG